MKTFKIGGIHPAENKLSATSPIEVLPLPKTVYIPFSQVLGAPSVPVVEKGAKVKVGQLLAKGEAFISANVHSSVSGTISKIDDIIDVSGYKRKAFVIEVEGDEWLPDIDKSPNIKNDINLTPEEIINKIKEMGIVGLGGATFPTHIKLMVPKDKQAEVLIINGVECEPFLTSDHRLMLEKGEEIMIGTSILMKAIGVNKAIIGIENNKPDAIKYLQELSKDYPNITVQALKVKYPQGGEKQLIQALTGRYVPSGKLPIEVGTIVNNVGTVYAVYEAIQKNKPLFERIVTVTGKHLNKTANFKVRIGTPINLLIEAVGGLPKDTLKIISGGPMMGKALASLETPVIKGMSGIVILTEKEKISSRQYNCIRCGKCIQACPMGLQPYLLSLYSIKDDFEQLEQNNIMDCIECGSCGYTCPAHIYLVDNIRAGKNKVGQIIRSRVK
ncbi:MAG TPA: electron transport complex subunit RsxC [Bacteroidales bacterium]|nr:electron transport complex subunit RsxC [Bacteroidales bacterium]